MKHFKQTKQQKKQTGFIWKFTSQGKETNTTISGQGITSLKQSLEALLIQYKK